ncbi:hypothetical protein Sinac_5605 [Singulisphaera acidiphila DSM 18658]|uniref:Uncharacterized protein n=1 Tax=Singulisphaera acidiphila (strain ATCC BAA-1392 / DSM 18658 / VKM B-2454 / MOB10) TaxID=886293 RepID=L0DLL7_SINAD|nr:hypothetical protein Sinac_5605 [Singulisphaera acidiphila DSM 18658]
MVGGSLLFLFAENRRTPPLLGPAASNQLARLRMTVQPSSAHVAQTVN